jgi:FMN phosphatase YigB (HAD superfamily)
MNYICLDIGNVLCRVDAVPFLENLSETFNITIPEASRFLKRFQQLHDLGYTTMEDELKDQFGAKSPITLSKLVTAWNDSVTPDLHMISRLNHLRDAHGLKVALLSNIGVEHASKLESKLSHGGFFPNVIKHFSCFVGARKPSTIFYQSFLLQYPEFKGCLYVDDLQENLDSSKAFGFQTFRLDLDEPNSEDRIRELEEQIVQKA